MRSLSSAAILLVLLGVSGSVRAEDMEVATTAPPADKVARLLNLDLSQMAEINAEQAERSKAAGLELTCMCGTCPHRTIKECDCGWAAVGRKTIEALVAKGMTEEQIIGEFRRAYGDQVLAMLPNEGFGKAAWLLPYGASLVGLLVMILVGLKMRARARTQGSEAEIDSPEPGRQEARRELIRELEEMD
jgi:cytochrome c-type biogenesis protein CcmH/NrfF